METVVLACAGVVVVCICLLSIRVIITDPYRYRGTWRRRTHPLLRRHRRMCAFGLIKSAMGVFLGCGFIFIAFVPSCR